MTDFVTNSGSSYPTHPNPLDKTGLEPLPFRQKIAYTPFIENVSFHGMQKGMHYDPGPSGVWISITDPAMAPAKPAFKFSEWHEFHFLDIDKTSADWDEMKGFAITEEDGKKIADILMNAFFEGRNVIVSCVAGLCRSGAVVEAGIARGFQDTGVARAPNVLVKNAILKEMNWDD